jgi:hypothetical protein
MHIADRERRPDPLARSQPPKHWARPRGHIYIYMIIWKGFDRTDALDGRWNAWTRWKRRVCSCGGRTNPESSVYLYLEQIGATDVCIACAARLMCANARGAKIILRLDHGRRRPTAGRGCKWTTRGWCNQTIEDDLCSCKQEIRDLRTCLQPAYGVLLIGGLHERLLGIIAALYFFVILVQPTCVLST